MERRNRLGVYFLWMALYGAIYAIPLFFASMFDVNIQAPEISISFVLYYSLLAIVFGAMFGLLMGTLLLLTALIVKGLKLNLNRRQATFQAIATVVGLFVILGSSSFIVFYDSKLNYFSLIVALIFGSIYAALAARKLVRLAPDLRRTIGSTTT